MKNKIAYVHPGVCGTYLAACLFYKAITQNDGIPKKIPEGISPEESEALRKIAAQF